MSPPFGVVFYYILGMTNFYENLELLVRVISSTTGIKDNDEKYAELFCYCYKYAKYEITKKQFDEYIKQLKESKNV